MAKPIKHLQLVLKEIDQPTVDVKRFIFADQDDWKLPSFLPGAHIDIYLRDGLVRTYSLCNDPKDNHRYVIAVKLEKDGRGGSRYMHDELRIGDIVGVSVPRGGMRFDLTSMNVLVAGGIGVTPFISLVRTLETMGLSNYVLHWSSMGDPSLLDMIKPAYEKGQVILYDTLKVPLPNIDRIVHSYGDDALAFCCGPSGMLDAFEVATLEWPQEKKHIERFTAPKPVLAPDAKPYTVVLSISNKEMEVRPEVGLVATLEAMESNIPFSCEGGICGACRTTWTEGPPIHNDRVLTPDERTREVIVCVAGCAGDHLVLEV
jgi:vanillate O-demethylase ferredoxin subunit